MSWRDWRTVIVFLVAAAYWLAAALVLRYVLGAGGWC